MKKETFIIAMFYDCHAISYHWFVFVFEKSTEITIDIILELNLILLHCSTASANVYLKSNGSESIAFDGSQVISYCQYGIVNVSLYLICEPFQYLNSDYNINLQPVESKSWLHVVLMLLLHSLHFLRDEKVHFLIN